MTRDEVIQEMYDEYMRIVNRKKTIKKSDMAYKAISKADGAADTCISIGADPRLYVQIIEKKHGQQEFFPNLLNSKKAPEWYKQYSESSLDVEKNTFDVQLQYLLNSVRGGRTMEAALLDDRLQMEPWFRIVVSKEPIPEVIEKYSDFARERMTTKIEALIKEKNLDIGRINEPGRYI